MRLGAVLIAPLILLGGCSHATQVSSGSMYLAGVERARGTAIPEAVRAAADVEPLLRFPARIGLARLSAGKVSPIPESEAAAWRHAAAELGPDYGEFVPVSNLLAEMMRPGQSDENRPFVRPDIGNSIEALRLAAARQHLDAVLIYESAGTANRFDNPLSVADVTIVGMFVVPSKDVEAVGQASAMLLDVRNGYVYGQATAAAEDSTVATSDGSWSASERLAARMREEAARKLAGEVVAMMRTLKPQLGALPAPAPAQGGR